VTSERGRPTAGEQTAAEAATAAAGGAADGETAVAAERDIEFEEIAVEGHSAAGDRHRSAGGIAAGAGVAAESKGAPTAEWRFFPERGVRHRARAPRDDKPPPLGLAPLPAVAAERKAPTVPEDLTGQYQIVGQNGRAAGKIHGAPRTRCGAAAVAAVVAETTP